MSADNTIKKIPKYFSLVTIVFLCGALVTCIVLDNTLIQMPNATNSNQQQLSATSNSIEVIKMANVTDLNQLLTDENWQAVDLATKLQDDAWPALEVGVKMPSFRSRQISMVSIGVLGTDKAIPMLIAGLEDKHINVRLAAAGQLSTNTPDNAEIEISQKLRFCEEDNICTLLIRGLGNIPGDISTNSILEFSQEHSGFEQVAQLALAKLDHPASREKQVELFNADSAYVRYQALVDLLYIADKNLLSFAKPLLADTSPAVTIGTPYDEQHRRVCDQAVDTLVNLLQLSPSFTHTAESIYSVEQINEIQSLVN